MKKGRKKRKQKKIWIFLLFIILFVAGIYWLQSQGKIEMPKFEEKKQLKIVDLNSSTRPYAVMINNHEQARLHHTGLQDAYLVYEIIVEGGLTRMMALYKDQTTAKIGSVRSARHYFLDYALENDAIYAHYGWSPQAESDIKQLQISNINGLYDQAFWRDQSLKIAYEHKAFTSMEKLKQVAINKGYRTTSTQKLLLSYQVDLVDLSLKENSIPANTVTIPYSNYVTTSYTYDSVNQVYLRSVGGKAHVDDITKQQYTTKNIIIEKVRNYSIDAYGRQALDHIGSGEGYYITCGYAVPITWTKTSRTAQTKYYYQSTTDEKVEIEVNDGNTFIQIMPIGKTPSIEKIDE